MSIYCIAEIQTCEYWRCIAGTRVAYAIGLVLTAEHVSRHGENHVTRHIGFLHILVASYALTRYVADADRGALSFRTDISNLCMTPTGTMQSAVSDDLGPAPAPAHTGKQAVGPRVIDPWWLGRNQPDRVGFGFRWMAPSHGANHGAHPGQAKGGKPPTLA